MAERRMLSKQIIMSDAFLDLPATTRALYLSLSMMADDDGFINSPKSIMRQCGASADDMDELLDKKFLISFDSGVVVIKHWKIHNYIQNDRYKRTAYADEFAMLEVEKNKSYRLRKAPCIQDVSNLDTQGRLGKVRLGKVSIERVEGFPPTLEQIKEYCSEKKLIVSPEGFFNYYSAQDWYLSNGQRMKDQRSKLLDWERGDREKAASKKKSGNRFNDFQQRETDYESIEQKLLEM